MMRKDERTIMFARMRYQKGTKAYEDYYSQHPDQEGPDQLLREMPQPFGQGTATYHPQLSPFGDAGFAVIDKLKTIAHHPVSFQKTDLSPHEMTQQLKAFAKYLGASDVGITALRLEDMYSVRGRNDYGQPITETLANGLVLCYEMDQEAINRAPQLEEGFEVVKAYMQLAMISLWLSHYIKDLGYEARAHIDGDYLAYLPPLAVKAGLGEMGRMNTLIHPEFGARVRLAMVSTDMPLEADRPITFDLETFCKLCNKCSRTCPGKAISADDMTPLRDGQLGWPYQQEACYAVWRRVGTDCGVCLSVCPFSQGLTEEEQALYQEGLEGMKAALASYTKRIPIRVYHPKTLKHLQYPKAPLTF